MKHPLPILLADPAHTFAASGMTGASRLASFASPPRWKSGLGEQARVEVFKFPERMPAAHGVWRPGPDGREHLLFRVANIGLND